MTAPYFTHSDRAMENTLITDEQYNDNFDAVEASFDLLPDPSDISDGIIASRDATATGNDYDVTIASITSYTDFTTIRIKPDVSSTGSARLQINALGYITIKRDNLTATLSGDLQANSIYTVSYSATDGSFVLQTAPSQIVTESAANAALTAADVVSTNADVLLTNADVVSTNADVVSTNADVVSTNADAAQTALDVIATNADVVSTNADAAQTALDVIATNADVVSTNADAAQTALDVIATNADVVSTNADVVSTNADVVSTNADVLLTNADVVTTNADAVSTDADAISAAASAAAAAASAATVNLPSIDPGDADKILQVNVGETGYNHVVLPESNSSNLAKSGLLSGTLSLDDTVLTNVQVNKTYTGNGTSQSITTNIASEDINWVTGTAYVIGDIRFTRDGTGVTAGAFTLWQCNSDHTAGAVGIGTDTLGDSVWTVVADDTVKLHNSSRVWIKSRGGTTSNLITNTLQGPDNFVYTNSTQVESSGFALTSFNNDGFSVGSGSAVNANTQTFIAWQEAYHKVMITTTNQSKRALIAFDDVNNRSMILYQGSGTAGHEIPHGLGQVPDVTFFKNLDVANVWLAKGSNIGDQSTGDYLLLETNDALLNSAGMSSTPSSSVISIGTNSALNGSNNYIAYCEANSDNIKIGTYSGTGAAGNEIHLGFKPSRVMVKRINDTRSWYLYDNQRISGSEDYALFPNGTTVEGTGTDYFSWDSDGITFTSELGTNSLGDEFLFIAYADTDADGGGSETNLPSSTTNVQATLATLGYSDGYNSNGAVNSAEDISGTITPTLSEGLNYFKKEEGGSWTATLVKPVFGEVDGFGDFRMSNGKWYQPSTNLVSNGDFSNDTTTGWTIRKTGVLTVVNGKMKVENGTTDYGGGYYNATTVVGTRYRLKVKVIDNPANPASNGALIRGGLTSPGTDNYYFPSENVTYGNGTTEVIKEFTAVGTDFYLLCMLNSNASGDAFFVDNIQLYSLEESDWTAYTTPIEYLNKAFEADASGNVAAIHDFNYASLVEDTVNFKNVEGLDVPIFEGYLNTDITSTNLIIPWTTVIDTHSSMDGGIWTCEKAGLYDIIAHLSCYGDAQGGPGATLILNSNTIATFNFQFSTATGDHYIYETEYKTLELSIGDTLYFKTNVNVNTDRYFKGGTSANYSNSVSIKYLGNNFTTGS